MKKKELIHFHGLLGALTKNLADDGVVTESDLIEYRDLGTTPMTMHGSRSDHREAALKLAETLADAVDAADAADDEETYAETEPSPVTA